MGAQNKDLQELFDTASDLGMTCKEVDGGTLVTEAGGLREWLFDKTPAGLHRVRQTAGKRSVPPNHEDRTGRLMAGVVAFGDLSGAHRKKNVISDLAKIVGLDLRARPKRAANEPDLEEPEKKEEETVVQAEEQALQTMKEIVDDILNPQNLRSVIDLLHTELLARARDENAPVVWEKEKKYLHWEGDLVEILQQGWDGFDPAHEEMGRLERELPLALRRSGLLERVLVNPATGKQTWQVRDDGRVLEQPIPVLEEDAAKNIPLDLNPVLQEEREPEGAAVQPAPVVKPPRRSPRPPANPQLQFCDKCAFADYSPQALARHKTAMRDFKDGMHPQEAYACLYDDCGAVRTQVPTLIKHMQKKHYEHGLSCGVCTDKGEVTWFTTADTYDEHKAGHKVGSVKTPRKRAPKVVTQPLDEAVTPSGGIEELPVSPAQEAVSVPETTPEPKPALSPVGTAVEPSGSLSGRVVVTAEMDDAVERAAIDLIHSIPELRRENQELREEVADLRDQVKALEGLEIELETEREGRKNAEERLAAIVAAQQAVNRLMQQAGS